MKTDGNTFTTNRLLQEIKTTLFVTNLGVWALVGHMIGELIRRAS